MNLPTIEPIPDEKSNLPPARRRRQRRMIIPPGSSERADFLLELAYRTEPSFDFFLFSLLSGLILGAALLLDSPALVVLAVLIAPFMAPSVGISLGTITGAARFVLQSLGSLGIGSLIVFLCGALSGWAVNLLPARVYQQAGFHSHFTWPDFLVLALGAGLTSYLMVRTPKQKPMVTSVAIAYGLYLPVGVAGFGMTSGISGLWPEGLGLFVIHLVWAALIGTLVLGFLGIKPLNPAGYLLSFAYSLTAVALLVIFYIPLTSQPPSSTVLPGTAPTPSRVTAAAALPPPSTTPKPSASPSRMPPTSSPTADRTNTLIPTRTATLTVTPQPTPVWARISAQGADGALVRSEPNYESEVVQSLLNTTLVEILPDVQNSGGASWVHIRTTTGKEGWMVRSLLRTATPEVTQ